MAASVSVQTPALAVDPGQRVSTELRLRNTGDVVDQFAFQPLGDAAGWITVDPPVVRLFPDTDQIVTVTIAPPREPTSKPGVSTWALKVIPQEDPDGAAVGEGTVDVGEFVEVSAELQPLNGRGRLSGRFDIAVDNRGNVPVPVRLLGSDTEQVLGFEFSPIALDTAPGSAHFSKLSIKPPTKIWRGTPKTYPFQLVAEPQMRATGVTNNDESPMAVAQVSDAPTSPGAVAVAAPSAVVLAAPPIVLAGNFVQEAIIPKWLWKALLALVALIIALWIVWKTLLEPEVESAARAVAIEEVAEVAEDVETLSTEVEQAEQQAAEAQETAEAAADAAGAGAEEGGGGGGAPPTTAPGGGEGVSAPPTTAPGVTTVPPGQTGGPAIGADAVPTNFRLVAAADAGGPPGSSATGANPEGTTTAITDIILQNPSGDIGFIRVIVNGQVIIEAALESFSTQDFHYVAPYVVQPGQAAGIEVSCAPDQIVAGDPCSPAVSFAGYTTSATPAGG